MISANVLSSVNKFVPNANRLESKVTPKDAKVVGNKSTVDIIRLSLETGAIAGLMIVKYPFL